MLLSENATKQPILRVFSIWTFSHFFPDSIWIENFKNIAFLKLKSDYFYPQRKRKRQKSLKTSFVVFLILLFYLGFLS